MLALNNREIAILAWLGGFALLSLRYVSSRTDALAVVRILCQRALISWFVVAATYVGLSVFILNEAGLWELSNLKTTMLWALTFALATASEVTRNSRGEKIIWKTARKAVGITAIVQFIGQVYVFPLWAEMILVPALTLVVMLRTVASLKPETERLVGPLTFVQLTAGLGMVGYSAFEIAANLMDFETLATAREFAVPILLSFMTLPLLYSLLMYALYEDAIARIGNLSCDPGRGRRAIRRAALSFAFSPELFRRFVRDISKVDDLDDVAVGQMIERLHVSRKREKDPPLIPWSEGWSPYRASEYLQEEGFWANDYHLDGDEWIAETAPVEIGGMLFDRITYRVRGTEHAATMLEVVLDARIPGAPDQADERFWRVCCSLVSRSLGSEAERLFSRCCFGRAELVMDFPSVTARLSRDAWGEPDRGGYERRLELRHDAHTPNKWERMILKCEEDLAVPPQDEQ